MRGLMYVFVAIVILEAADLFLLDRRYSDAVWREANYQSQVFNYSMKRWLHGQSAY